MLAFATFLFAKNYTITACANSSYDDAYGCAQNSLDDICNTVHILKTKTGKYEAICNAYDTQEEADSAKSILQNQTKVTLNTKQLSFDIENAKFSSAFSQNKAIFNSADKVLITVNSITNRMVVKAFLAEKTIYSKTYVVSTGKKSVKKPTGEGKISSIIFNPIWYPTDDTIKAFKAKGVVLPKEVPPNHPKNFLGPAKMNLTHKVDGKETYRIHGTLNERTIGSNESAGCIRMKNKEALELAKNIDNFAKQKNINNVVVVLK